VREGETQTTGAMRRGWWSGNGRHGRVPHGESAVKKNTGDTGDNAADARKAVTVDAQSPRQPPKATVQAGVAARAAGTCAQRVPGLMRATGTVILDSLQFTTRGRARARPAPLPHRRRASTPACPCGRVTPRGVASAACQRPLANAT